MNYSYKDQLEVLSGVIRGLKEGRALRNDCPFCGGKNTFGISKNGGKVSWGCFKASCGAHGTKDVGLGLNGIRQKLGYDGHIRSYTADDKYTVPTPLVSVERNDDIITWLKNVHSYQSYAEGLVEIRYSPTEDRVMFKIPDLEGWIGRKLPPTTPSKRTNLGPKWLKYGDTSHIFKCGNGPIGVIVEDAPSACAIGTVEGLTGVALLSTTLTQQHKVDLRQFDSLIVCLDPDAASKSLTLAKRLEGAVPTTVKLIPDDLKWYGPQEIRDILCV